ncbi:hypothetical protein N7492_002002 [Penicillium capsulatum]|uniref:Uncharacterized protein n=1 Tax=Penicillium capsulatum TaxID=69766 RepID=A0A9W9LVY2_9EURO|nr:hypothetical protein N7492_002002 [Penicillium capsulatum]KAJ6123378.1 hypothetical protein N7512_005843 [Penicillium capsulatum]
MSASVLIPTAEPSTIIVGQRLMLQSKKSTVPAILWTVLESDDGDVRNPRKCDREDMIGEEVHGNVVREK